MISRAVATALFVVVVGALGDECSNPSGVDCTFYSKCVGNRVQCDIVDRVATPKCDEYLEAERKMSDQGKKWSQYVRKCLQVELANKVLSQPSFTCDDVANSFFTDHLPCYLSPDTGLEKGFCGLPFLDRARVYAIASSIFFQDWGKYAGEAAKSAGNLLKACGERFFWLSEGSSRRLRVLEERELLVGTIEREGYEVTTVEISVNGNLVFGVLVRGEQLERCEEVVRRAAGDEVGVVDTSRLAEDVPQHKHTKMSLVYPAIAMGCLAAVAVVGAMWYRATASFPRSEKEVEVVGPALSSV
eukprot:Sspe_Gene.13160::Locus_4511_Transcript_2_2_Confidence_0.750_Length_1160::g.13160::m.13160